MPPGHFQDYGARWDPPKSAEGTGGAEGQVTLHHLLAVLANREVPDDWRIANITPIYKKGQKKDPRKYRPVSLTLVPGKIMERFILCALTADVKDNQIRPRQHGLMKGRSCLTNLISFYDQMMHLVDEGQTVDVIYPDFSKAFDTAPPSILLETLATHGLDGCTLCWIKN